VTDLQLDSDDLVIDESRYPPALAVLVAAVLYATLPSAYVTGNATSILGINRFVLPALEILLLIPLVLTAPRRVSRFHLVERLWRRRAVIALVGLISLANAGSIVLLVHFIITGHEVNGHELFRAAINIWLTNVIVFALFYWETDRGGPVERSLGTRPFADFLFPQMDDPDRAPPDWEPMLVDYLYLAFTNATAFSPTDVLPLSRWAKLAMLVQSALSLTLVALVVARAVNLLAT
jgi:uncharacterized membrane protein